MGKTVKIERKGERKQKAGGGCVCVEGGDKEAD